MTRFFHKLFILSSALFVTIEVFAANNDIITAYHYANIDSTAVKYDSVCTVPKDSGSFVGIKEHTILIETNPQTFYINRQVYAVNYFDDSVEIMHSSGAVAKARVNGDAPITLAIKGSYASDSPHYWDNIQNSKNDTTFAGEYRYRHTSDTMYRYYAITHYTDIDSVVFNLQRTESGIVILAVNHANTQEYTDYTHEYHSNRVSYRDTLVRKPFEHDTILEVPLVAQSNGNTFWAAAELSILGYQRYEDVTNCEIMEVGRLTGGIAGADRNCCDDQPSCNQTISIAGADTLHEYFDLAKVRVDGTISVPEIQHSLNLFGPIWIGIANQGQPLSNALVLHGIKDSVCYLMNPVSGKFETKHYRDLVRDAYGKWAYTLAPRFSRLGSITVTSPTNSTEYYNPIAFSFGLDTAMNGYQIRLMQNGSIAKDTAPQTKGISMIDLNIGESYRMVARGFKVYPEKYVGRKFGTWTSDTTNFKVKNDVGVKDDFGNSSIRICPNPATEYIEIIADPSLAAARYEIHDIIGSKLLSGTLSNQISASVGVSELPAGTYLILIRNEKNEIILKSKIIKY